MAHDTDEIFKASDQRSSSGIETLWTRQLLNQWTKPYMNISYVVGPRTD